ncbi:uncharacterized protein [Amphiura filiformis]|uniref:uncharacterized protein n=1 Tax=Amphiura filiformis TaxID=82378 RepID=UPI003B21F97E
MAGYQPRTTAKASIVLLFFSVSLFAVFLSCKDHCLFYSFQDHYWISFWTAILGIFSACLGLGLSCSKGSRGQRNCEGRCFCIFMFLFLLVSLVCAIFAARPILGHFDLNLNNQTKIPFILDLMHNNLTSIDEDFRSNSLIHWGAMAGIAVCLALVSLIMCCMFCCCCQEAQDPYEAVPRPRQRKQKKKKQERQPNRQPEQRARAPAGNPNPSTTAVTVQMDHIRGITSPIGISEARPPPYAPSVTGNIAGDATLFGHASAPHFTDSATLQRDLARERGGWSGSSQQNMDPDSPPDLPTSPRPSTLNRAANPADYPPDVPTSPRPSTLNRQADNNPPEVPITPRPSIPRMDNNQQTSP